MPGNLPAHTYTSTASRHEPYWLVQCDQHPHIRSKVRLLAHAADHQRSAIASFTGVAEQIVVVDVRPVLPEAAEKHICRARELRGTAAWANHAAAEEARAAARVLAKAKLSLRDIGTILGVSYQRAHQLIHS